MKQITPEIKAKIFALYWGQQIIVHDRMDGLYWIVNETHLNEQRGNTWLEVKPLSSITDEDAIAIGEIRGDWKESPLVRGKATINFLDNSDFDSTAGVQNLLEMADYLRSKGYALPAYGFSVDELVEAGVFKLKEVNND